MRPDIAQQWILEPEVDFLNHGSFGACPRAVLDRQSELRAELERSPVRFLFAELEARLDSARAALAAFVGATAEDVVWVQNASAGVGAVLRSLALDAGDEIVVSDHGYNACKNAVDYVCARAGARAVVAEIPFPIDSAEQVTSAFAAVLSSRTRLVLVDHVTSPTGLIFPVADIIGLCAARDIDVLVDGAHAPGMIPLELDSLGAAYYTGNCHKWLCAPKGAGFLYVRPDRQADIIPPIISHGASSPRTDKSRFQLQFGWPGTHDPTAYLSVPDALEWMSAAVPGGWDEIRRRNRALCLEGRDIVCAALGIAAPAPDDMIGSLAAFPVGDTDGPPSPQGQDPLNGLLYREARIEVPVFHFPWPRRLARISAQLYNHREQYERLAEELTLRLPPRAA